MQTFTSNANGRSVQFIDNGTIIYCGVKKRRIEARIEMEDGNSTYTDAHFIVPIKATREQIVRRYIERSEPERDDSDGIWF